MIEQVLPGNDILVGKAVDSDRTYQGSVGIASSLTGLIVTRRINGKTTKVQARIESANGGEAKVLRIRFTEAQTRYGQTCLVAGDLDNYARISCYLYRSSGNTTQPGLEVLFHDPAPVNRACRRRLLDDAHHGLKASACRSSVGACRLPERFAFARPYRSGISMPMGYSGSLPRNS